MSIFALSVSLLKPCSRTTKQKQRQKIREDPEAHEKAKHKERERNLKRKRQGKLVSIKAKTPREQHRHQKKCRENIRNYRVRKENVLRTEILPSENLPEN